MTPTEELAGLLRRCAEKWSEKFGINEDNGLMVLIPPFLPTVYFDLLISPSDFTLDHMDAIAGAVGMEFEVYRFQRNAWRFYIYVDGERTEWLYQYTESFPSKRLASLAALSACLKYALEAP